MTRKQRTERGLTLSTVTIPAGSEVTRIPYSRVEKYDYVSVLVSHDKDATSEWTMPVEDAVRMGIVPADFSAKPENPGKPQEPIAEQSKEAPESFA